MRVMRMGNTLAPLPAYQTSGAAGLDIASAECVTIWPGGRALVSTGWAIAIPEGFEGQIRPRSGLAKKHGITVLNTPGTIDSDYRGEVMVLLINHSKEPYTVRPGDRIAQLIIAPVTRVELVEVATLDDTKRGEGGFGSTGA
jgi:dUTP pyrophosphatase